MSGGDPARAQLDARMLAWMHENEWKHDEARFEQLALELFAFQVQHCVAYERFCQSRGKTLHGVARWQEIPAVPAGAFKTVALRCFPAERTVHTFLTSGTATPDRGALHLDTLELYEASLLPTFERFLFPDLRPDERMRIRVLAPSPDEAPDSSLAHMFGCVLRRRGDPASGFDLCAGSLRVTDLLGGLAESVASATPVTLCGTALAFVQLLDALGEAGARLRLPDGSRVMETGGFKGRSRQVSREELYRGIEEWLGVAPGHIVNQYGMTELGSQFYDSVLRWPGREPRKLGPPWTRVRIVDPETGAESAPGEIGRIAIVDLANTGSVLAIQTADLGRRIEEGFEVIGREPGAEARGCSLALDAMGAVEP